MRTGTKGWGEYIRAKVRDRVSGYRNRELDFISSRVEGTEVAEQVDKLKELYRINMKAAYAYSMRPYRGKVSLFMLDESDLVGMIPDPDHYWRGLASNREVYLLGGTHASVLKYPHVVQTAAKVALALNEADMS